jgi:hypothetical protein
MWKNRVYKEASRISIAFSDYFLVYGQNLGKFGQKFVSVQLLRNDQVEFDNYFRDYRRYIVVVQHASYLHVNSLICIIMAITVFHVFC